MIRAYQRILVPIDFELGAFPAVGEARQIAGRFEATVVLQHVVTPAEAVAPGRLLVRDGTEEREATRRLQAIAALELKGVPHETIVTTGNPAPGILEAAQSQRIDLIVMATHGRSGIGRFVLGSVTEEIVRRAPCPVLTVRPE